MVEHWKWHEDHPYEACGWCGGVLRKEALNQSEPTLHTLVKEMIIFKWAVRIAKGLR